MIKNLILILLIFSSCSLNKDNLNLVNKEYKGKIVYKNNLELNTLKKDCQKRGGDFKECGNNCPKDSEFCTMVCVPVCIF
jgi:hypothetical protein